MIPPLGASDPLPPAPRLRQPVVRPHHRLAFHQAKRMDIGTAARERQMPSDVVFGPARAVRNHRDVLRLRHGQG